MDEKTRSNGKLFQKQYYEIRFKGQLDDQWTEWFGGMSITYEEDDTTMLSGPIADQAALHGLLKKIRDLGLTLISVCPGKSENFNTSISKKE
jgi:hypothetical protein